MITKKIMVEETWLGSSVRPDILVNVSPIDTHTAEVIEWADAHPVVYDVVTQRRSKAFGLFASTYIASGAGSMEPRDILYRASHVRIYATIGRASEEHGPAPSIWQWRANFTLDHYRDKGFTGGLFRQFDGTYDRGCCDLDYTPDTLGEVIAQFRQWCETPAGHSYPTAHISIDNEIVWKDGHLIQPKTSTRKPTRKRTR